MGIAYNTSIVSDGLVYAIDAANSRSYAGSGTTVNALVGGIGGTLVNGVGFGTSNLGSFYFDGTDDHLLYSNLDVVKWQNWTQMTMEFIFTLDSHTGASANRQYLFDGRDNGGTNGALGLFYDKTGASITGLKLFHNTVSTSYEELAIVSSLTLGSIIHYQVSFDKTTSSNNIRHYINGENVFNRSVTINSTTSNSGRVWFGRYSGGNYLWNGNLYSFKFYNRILTQQELKQNYNATKKRYGL